MATLNGQPINTSYSGLIKTNDNGTAGTSGRKQLSDGQGNLLPIEVSQTDVLLVNPTLITGSGLTGITADQNADSFLYTGTQDFTGATVTGLSAGTSGTSGSSGVNGIVSGKLFYFNQSQSSDIAPFKVLAEAPNGPEQTVEQIDITTGEARLVSSFLTPALGFDLIPAGVQRFHMHFLKTAQIHDFEGYCTIELANSAGVGYGTILPSSNALVTWIDAATPVEIETDLILPSTSILPTDRMIVKVYAKNIGTGSRTITWYTEGIQNYSYVTTSIAAQSGTSGTSGSSGTNGSAAPAGLVNGTGTNSLKQDNALTADDAQANGNSGIALGNGAKANGSESVAIGDFAEATQTGCAAVGQYAEASATYASAWGRTSYARSDGSVAFGQQAGVPPGLAGGVAIGRQVQAVNADTTHVRALYIVAPDGGTGGNGMTLLSPNGTPGAVTLTNDAKLAINGTPIGGGAAGLVAGAGVGSMKSADTLTTTPASAAGARSIALGFGASAAGIGGISIGDVAVGGSGVTIGDAAETPAFTKAIAIGNGAAATAADGVAIGSLAYTSATNAIAIGKDATASATASVAIGQGVTASRANVATIKELELQTIGGGIFMKSPDGTVYKLTVANGGTLTVTAV